MSTKRSMEKSIHLWNGSIRFIDLTRAFFEINFSFVFSCKPFETGFLSLVTAWCQAEVVLEAQCEKCFKITGCEG